MCWSETATIAATAIGAGATAIAIARRDPAPIYLALGYFTGMEALQIAGYWVIDQCGTPGNRAVTWLSYLHIVFQPFFINAFAMTLAPAALSPNVRRWVYAVCALSAAIMLAQILPLAALGACSPGFPLCGEAVCTRSGEWHLAWDVPYNGLLVPFEAALGTSFGFPSYLIAVFVLPLLYGAWRFVVFHVVAGPILASLLTDDPNEMPAIWCLFSVGLLLIALSSRVRRVVTISA
ncbi:DUF5765 domain-containing protein [Jannaschia seohaensis]|uniref:Uncharacterized protein n=1 Tax=Jannaschia seohaensis TaxID=475081 RepID=A0A2Y9A880_9RHOB|nr:DUF5765 domain-containing protein [Jannaschia seohaensis]PWJ22109.1 hypothetical protein BCF38_101518 [Jannaschia seohaensis]SSA38387.1 hypothetical protein SAMN05421539_101518 [Jannaschia seohaensis]